MTLFGPSLAQLFKCCKYRFSISTQTRLGMQILYGIKQLHDVGYIHRDLKPANLAIGRKGPESGILYLFDFGLAREFVFRQNDRIWLRHPGENTLFRGTARHVLESTSLIILDFRYCSANAHSKSEQGRPHDLWSMVSFETFKFEYFLF